MTWGQSLSLAYLTVLEGYTGGRDHLYCYELEKQWHKNVIDKLKIYVLNS